MRRRLYQELDWLRECNVEVLSDQQLSDLVHWVRAELAEHGRARCPVAGKVVKERRMGQTNRMGWRWVVYTAPVKLNTKKSELEWSERGVYLRRYAAYKGKARTLALEAAELAKERLNDARVSCG